MKKHSVPSDGIQGLFQNVRADMLSGFLVFLLALPLSLGIAAASDFPPLYGLITAMVGGLVVSFFAGSPLTIKGPAAGLIVIVAGSVAELGNGNNELGWKLALGAIVVAGIVQIVFGFLKFGSLTDVFPISAVHGMLAAIGIIIMSKQLHVLVGMNPLTADGRPMIEPIELIFELKKTILHVFDNGKVAIVGIASLLIVFIWPLIAIGSLKKVPSAVIVLCVAVPLAKFVGLHNTPDVYDLAGNLIEKGYTPLLSFDRELFDLLGVKVDFGGWQQPVVFVKYVVMFALVGSLESLLTVKAMDMKDPYKRRSNRNKELVAIGVGNVVTGLIGGLPMISEVARSSANVSNGAQTRWANFFHGFFVFLFLCFEITFDDLIPKSALAAMLIGVGWKLAHPREFGLMIRNGKDAALIFISTIVATLFTDLMIGIAIGVLISFVLDLAKGVSLRLLFKPSMKIDGATVVAYDTLVFSNFTPLRRKLLAYNLSDTVTLDCRACSFIDHSVVELLLHMRDDFYEEGGQLIIIGIDELNAAHSTK